MDLLTRIEASLEFMNDGGPIGDRVDFVNLREVLEGSREALLKLDERQRYIEHITDESKAFKLLHSKAVDERDAALSRLGAAENRLDLIDRMRINLPEKFWHAELTAILAGERDETAGAVERQEPNPDYVPQIGPAHCRKT